MKRVILVIALIAFAFAYYGCSDSNITGVEQPVKVAYKDVPFKGTWEGLTYTTGLFTRLIACSGNCTHLGLFNAEVNYTLSYNDPNFPPNPLLGGGIESGSAEMTAANGDKLYLTGLNGTWYVISATNPMIGFTGNLTVSGGTGRFANATGSFEGSGTQYFYIEDPLRAQEVWYSWSGTISY